MHQTSAAGSLETTVWQQCFYNLLRVGICCKILSTNIGNYQSSQPFQHQPSTQSLDGSIKQNVQCNYSHRFGHMKFECQKCLAAQARQNASQPTAQVVELPDQGEAAFFAF